MRVDQWGAPPPATSRAVRVKSIFDIECHGQRYLLVSWRGLSGGSKNLNATHTFFISFAVAISQSVLPFSRSNLRAYSTFHGTKIPYLYWGRRNHDCDNLMSHLLQHIITSWTHHSNAGSCYMRLTCVYSATSTAFDSFIVVFNAIHDVPPPHHWTSRAHQASVFFFSFLLQVKHI
jgi:hypothetical protein